MPERWRRETVQHALVWGLAMLVVSILTACAGPGGEGLSTIGAAATANDRLTTPGGTASATGSAAASTGTTAGRTVAAAGSAAVGSTTMGTAARSPVAAGSMTAASAASTRSGATPATSASATPAAVGSATRPTTGSATAGGAAATQPGTTTASTSVIPPPPNGMEYVQGSNMIIDTILKAAEQGLSSSSDSVVVTSSKDYTSTSAAMDVGAFYRMQMPMLGWKSEQDQNSDSGITTLVYSRDNQTNAALILIVDLSQVNLKGCLVITATAKPK